MKPEKLFESYVKAFLKSRGIWHLKTWSNGIQRAGVPDIIACCNGYFVGIEIKAENGKPSELQLYNIKRIRDNYGFAFVLYPSGFDDFKKFITDLEQDEFTLDMPIALK